MDTAGFSLSWGSVAGLLTAMTMIGGAFSTYVRLAVLSEVDRKLSIRQKEWQEFVTRLSDRFGATVQDLAKQIPSRELMNEKFGHLSGRLDTIDQRQERLDALIRMPRNSHDHIEP